MSAGAAGNVTDNSNQQRVVFDYGLPSANMVFGFTMEVLQLMGFDVYAEYDINRDYTSTPTSHSPTRTATCAPTPATPPAWMVNVSKQAYPFFLFGEAFSMDPDYSTTAFIVRFRRQRVLRRRTHLHV